MNTNRKIINAEQFSDFLKRIGYEDAIAFPCNNIKEGRIKPNTSMDNNMCLVSDVDTKNYIWKLWDQHVVVDNDAYEVIWDELKPYVGKTLRITSRKGWHFVFGVDDKHWNKLNRPVTRLKFEGFDGKIDICTPILLKDTEKGYVKDNVLPNGEGRGCWGPGSFKRNDQKDIDGDLPRNVAYDEYDANSETHFIAEGDDIAPIMLPDDLAEKLIAAIEKQGKGEKVVIKAVDHKGNKKEYKGTRLPIDKRIGDEDGKNHTLLNDLEMICRAENLEFESSMALLDEANQRCMVKPSSDEKMTELKKYYQKERKKDGFEGRYKILRIIEKNIDDITLIRMAMEIQKWKIKQDSRQRALVINSDIVNSHHQMDDKELIIKVRNSLKTGIKVFRGMFDTSKGKIIPKIDLFKTDRGGIKDVIDEYIFDHKEDPIYSDVLKVLEKDAEKILEENWDKERKVLDDSRFVSKTALNEIMSFKRDPDLNVRYPEMSDKYNKWAMFMALYPGVYNTMEAVRKMEDPTYNPAPVFGAVAAFIGGEGCFKSTWIPALLRNLPLIRGQSYYVEVDIGDDERNNIFKFEASWYTELVEGKGINKDIKHTKSIIGRMDDFIQRFFSDRFIFTPRRNCFYITSNELNLFDISDDPQRRYAPFFVAKLPSLTKEAMEKMLYNPEQYHNEVLDKWGKKYARRVFAELIAYYLTGRKPGLHGNLEKERVKAYQHSDGSAEFEDDFIDVLSNLYNRKLNSVFYDNNEVKQIQKRHMKTNYYEISYSLEHEPWNYSRDIRRSGSKHYTQGSIRKAYRSLTGEEDLPRGRHCYAKLGSDGVSLADGTGVYLDLTHPKLMKLYKDVDVIKEETKDDVVKTDESFEEVTKKVEQGKTEDKEKDMKEYDLDFSKDDAPKKIPVKRVDPEKVGKGDNSTTKLQEVA